jgi:hypothetical protein
MRENRGIAWLLLPCIISFLVFPAIPHAQAKGKSKKKKKASSQPALTAQEQKAKDLFEGGVAAYEEGNLTDAIDLLKESYSENPVPVVLYNLAIVEISDSRWASAGNHLNEYLGVEANMSEDRRSEILAIIESEVQPHAALVKVTDVEPGSTIMVDDSSTGDVSIRVGWWVEPGEHTVGLADGETRMVTALSGQTVSVELMKPIEVETPPSSRSKILLPGLLVGSTGLVLTGIGIGLLGGAASDRNKIENADQGTPWTDLEDEYSRNKTFGIAGGVLLGVGLAATLSGAVLVAVMSARSKDVSVSETALLLAPYLGSDGSGLVLSGRF